jgi:hypothetical protein
LAKPFKYLCALFGFEFRKFGKNLYVAHDFILILISDRGKYICGNGGRRSRTNTSR